MSSARSAYRPSQNRSSATRGASAGSTAGAARVRLSATPPRLPVPIAGALRGQHPDVLGQRAVRAGDEPAAGPAGHPGQAAGHQPVAVALGHRERAQHQVPRLQPAAGDHRGGAHLQRLLAAPATRVGLDPAAQVVLLPGGQLPAEQAGPADRRPIGLTTTGPGRRARAGGTSLAAPEGLAPGIAGSSPSSVRAAAGRNGQPRVLQHPGAQRVDHETCPRAGRLDQPGDAELGVGRSSSGSQYPASTRRSTTSTGSSRPTERIQTRPSRTMRSWPVDQREAQQGGQERLVEGGLTAGPGVSSTTLGTSAAGRADRGAIPARSRTCGRTNAAGSARCPGRAPASPGRRSAGSASRTRPRTAPGSGPRAPASCRPARAEIGGGQEQLPAAGTRSRSAARRKPGWDSTASAGTTPGAAAAARGKVGENLVQQLGALDQPGSSRCQPAPSSTTGIGSTAQRRAGAGDRVDLSRHRGFG